MLAKGRHNHLKASLSIDQLEAAFALFVEAHILRSHIAMGGQTIAQFSLRAAYCVQKLIVTVNNDKGIVIQIVQHLGLCLQNAIEIAKELKVSMADDSEHSNLGLDHLSKNGHITEVGNAHFHNCSLMFIGNSGHGHGDTDLIVQISVGLMYIQLLAEN